MFRESGFKLSPNCVRMQHLPTIGILMKVIYNSDVFMVLNKNLRVGRYTYVLVVVLVTLLTNNSCMSENFYGFPHAGGRFVCFSSKPTSTSHYNEEIKFEKKTHTHLI